MKYDNLPIITPEAVYEVQRDGYKFIRLSDEQIDKARKANKKLYLLKHKFSAEFNREIACVGVYVKVENLISIAL